MTITDFRDCPFCNESVLKGEHVFIKLASGDYMFTHYCNSKKSTLTGCVDIYGSTTEEIRDRWNGDYKE